VPKMPAMSPVGAAPTDARGAGMGMDPLQNTV
jgi:hypothetical protein